MIFISIKVFDIDFSYDSVSNIREALIDSENIDSIQAVSHSNLNLDKKRFDKICKTIKNEKIYSCRLKSGTTFLIDENEFKEIKSKFLGFKTK